jgi:hypothetical protein
VSTLFLRNWATLNGECDYSPPRSIVSVSLAIFNPLNLFNQKVETNRPFQFQKRSQLVIGAHNVTLSVAAMRVRNPDRSALRINGGDAAQTPIGFVEISRR